METRTVGRSGLRVSAVGIGCNNFGTVTDAGQSERIVRSALDNGVTLFDTAPIYTGAIGSSEEMLGRALGSQRDEAVIVTKFGMAPGRPVENSRRAILAEIDDSLRRLQTDHVDLYLLHFYDDRTPMAEILRTLDDIVTSGKARYVGACRLPAWRLVEAQWISRHERLHEFIVSESEYSLVERRPETDLFPALDEYGLSLLPYSPLASGVLTGKYKPGAATPARSRLGENHWNLSAKFLTPHNLQLADELAQFAGERGRTLLELAFSWLLSTPRVCSVIAGATGPEQVEANAAAADSWRLDAEELAEVDRICRASKMI